MATNAWVEPCPFCQGTGFSRWQLQLPVAALHTLQRLLLFLWSSLCISCVLFPAFSGNAGAVCDDLWLIRGYEVIEEVLQNICNTHVSVWWLLCFLLVVKICVWPVLVPAAGHGNTRLLDYQNTARKRN